MFIRCGKLLRPCSGLVVIAVLLLTLRPASADGGLFDNFISQLMTTAATAQNFLEDAYDQRQGRGTEPPPVAEVPSVSAEPLSPVLIPVGSIDLSDHQPAIPSAPPTTFATGTTTSTSTTTTTTTSTTHGTRAPLPFWNPFVWLRPKEPSIPYNPDTDLSTVSNRCMMGQLFVLLILFFSYCLYYFSNVVYPGSVISLQN
uniref:Uncharacterized protein n=1 Tax=Anopheles melas TaxID=34690 RepID=A0A182UIK2_9DIPT